MINKLKKLVTIIASLPSKLQETSRAVAANKLMLQEIHASIFLNTLKGDKPHFDGFTTFSMMPSTICHILNDILINERRSIIEFGSGNSTLFIARLIKYHNLEVSFFSVDQDEAWQKKLSVFLEEEGISGVVKFVSAPLAPCEFQIEDQDQWYDMDILNRNIANLTFDQVIVDGPMASYITHARYPAMPFLKTKMEDKSSIFLDDSNRPGEQKIIEEWEKQSGQKFSHTKRYSYLIQGSTLKETPVFYKELL